MKLVFVSFIYLIIFLTMPDEFKTGSASFDQSQKPLFTFGLIADVQYSDYDPAGTRYYRESISKLREALISLKEDSADFIINLGDLIDKDFKSIKPVLDIIDSSEHKTYHITGNHDYSVEPRLKKHLPEIQLFKKGHYSFVHEKIRFIFLNGNELSTYASNNKGEIKDATDYIEALKNEGSINALDWNGGIRRKQLEWLRDELNNSKEADEKVILFCHFPVWPENNHNLLNYKEVLSLLEKCPNIVAWFNGHNHAGNYGNFNMIHFVTIKGMVETETSNSFALVEVYKNKLWIKGYGREKSQILAF